MAKHQAVFALDYNIIDGKKEINNLLDYVSFQFWDPQLAKIWYYNLINVFLNSVIVLLFISGSVTLNCKTIYYFEIELAEWIIWSVPQKLFLLISKAKILRFCQSYWGEKNAS